MYNKFNRTYNELALKSLYDFVDYELGAILLRDSQEISW